MNQPHRITRFVWLVALLALSGCKLWTVRPLDWKEKKAATAVQQLDAAAYVESVWQSRVVPTVKEKAVDLATVLNALDADVEAAKQQYRQGSSNFLVKGEAVVMNDDQSSPHRKLTLRVPNYKGKTIVLMQVGPVFRGTALRDAVGFIKFNEFTNQIQFAEVSTKLHERVEREVVQEIDPHSGTGVAFHAAFTFNERDKVLLTPVVLEWKR
jgi:predicted lipoprotein